MTKATQQPTYRDAAIAILAGIGADSSSHPARRALGAVFIVEGHNAYWNPMNWTLPEKYPAYNSTGVRIYPSFKVGMKETAAELTGNERWARFVDSLHSPASRFVPLEEIAKVYAEWGDHPNFTQFTTSEIVARLNEEMPS